MSEVYLTKIERKTIFTKSLIFVLIMFIISDLTVTGPFWFNFIPWLFILGMVGSIKKIDSVLMSIISTFTVFVSSVVMNGDIYLECIITTCITLASIILGIFTGKMWYEFILEHRLVKYIKRSRKVIYIIAMIAMFLVSYVMVGLNSGNLVTYLKSRTNLKEYIIKTYNIEEFSIIKAQHVKTVPGKYTYKVKIDGQEVSFVPVTKDVFKDTNKDYRRLSALRNLEHETAGKISEILNKYSIITDAYVKYVVEYNSVAINPDTVVLNINYDKAIQEENMDKLYYEIASAIEELQVVKQVQKIIITINEKTLQIVDDNIQNITPDYIKGGFEIEEISE